MAQRNSIAMVPVTAERARRDLRWLLNNSPLVIATGEERCVWIGEADLNQLRKDLESEIDNITDALITPALAERRSGRYCEALLVSLILSCRRYNLLAHDLQVFENKRTLGAFDLIVREQAKGAVTHLELAFKQYLHRQGPSTDMHRWTGPRGRDRLDIKTNHMLSKQLKLGTTDAGLALLANLGIDQLDHTRAMMAGRLFVHYDRFQALDWPELPDICSKKPSFGWWIDQTEIAKLQAAANEWRVLTPQWAIAPLDSTDCNVLPAPNWCQLHEQVQGGIPALVAATKNGKELSRGWIVSDSTVT